MENFNFNECGVCTNPVTLRSLKTRLVEIEIRAAAVNGQWDAAISCQYKQGSASGSSRGVWQKLCNRSKGKALADAAGEVMEFLKARRRSGEPIEDNVFQTVISWIQGEQLTIF